MAAKGATSSLEIHFNLSDQQSQAPLGRLFIEFIKYLLYDRHQAPTTIDQLRFETEAELEDETKKGHRLLKTADYKKRHKLISDLDLLFSNLEELFSSTQVTNAVVMYGSTVVSPKETYVMNFDSNSSNSFSPSNKENTGIPQINGNRIYRKLIRSLITEPRLREFQELSITPMYVFVHVPRTVKNSWFRPKPAFKIPSRGNVCTITVSTELPGSNVELLTGNDEYIWLQAPITIKGYQVKSKDGEVFSDFWS